jgi:DNA-binding transcriptional LysR family regulator
MSETEPSWDFYRTFLAVVQQGSLSAAARELGLTQPTVGRHIDALERAIGAELFTRSQLGLLPTEAAVDLRPYAETLATTSAALLRSASGHRDRVSGTVRISASEVIGVEVLPPILAQLQRRYPDLTIELSASDIVEDLLQREADIAVRMAEPSQDALVVRRIGIVPLGFFAHRSYLEGREHPREIADLADHRMIGFDRQNAYIRAMMKRYPVLDPARFAFKSGSGLAQLAALRAGGGIGFCQIPLARQNPDLVHLLRDFHLPLETWVAMHENLKSSPRCRVTFDALVNGLLDYLGQGR